MDASVTPEQVPPWAIHWVIEIAVGIWGLLTIIIGWFTRKYIGIVDAFPETYATISRVKEMEEKIPELVSRTELLSFLQQMKEDSDKKNDEHVEAQLQMHRDNLQAGAEMRKVVGDGGIETRALIGAVHARVDALFARIK